MKTVAPGEVVFTHNIVDFNDSHPAWRLYMVSEAISRICDINPREYRRLLVLYEESLQRVPWGALYFVISTYAPQSTKRMATRVQSALNCWSSLQHDRYAYKTLGTYLSLEELLIEALGWVLDAWCPEDDGSLSSRFALASERMARATRVESTEAILRRLPGILAFADRQQLQHPEVVTDVASWREHLDALDASSFERISAVYPGEVLRFMYLWDRQLSLQ